MICGVAGVDSSSECDTRLEDHDSDVLSVDLPDSALYRDSDIFFSSRGLLPVEKI